MEMYMSYYGVDEPTELLYIKYLQKIKQTSQLLMIFSQKKIGKDSKYSSVSLFSESAKKSKQLALKPEEIVPQLIHENINNFKTKIDVSINQLNDNDFKSFINVIKLIYQLKRNLYSNLSYKIEVVYGKEKFNNQFLQFKKIIKSLSYEYQKIILERIKNNFKNYCSQVTENLSGSQRGNLLNDRLIFYKKHLQNIGKMIDSSLFDDVRHSLNIILWDAQQILQQQAKDESLSKKENPISDSKSILMPKPAAELDSSGKQDPFADQQHPSAV